MGLVQRDGIERLRHVMRYSRQHSTICTALVDAGWMAGVGAKMGPDPREMADADLIIVWGSNPASTQVNVMTHIAKARRERRAQLIVVDPYRTPTAKVADTHLSCSPGTDGALACAIMHVMFRDGHADREYMRTHTDVPGELEAHLASRTPQWAAAITGLPVAEIERVAKLYGTTKRASSASAMASRASATARQACTRCPASRPSAANGRTRRRHVLQQRRHLQDRKTH